MQKLVHNTLDSHAAVGTPRVRPVPAHVHTYVVAALLALVVPSLAHGATRYVADTGSDGPDCGLALTTACRSITKAIALANPGDTILVGPGRYGDLNRNGVLGEPGEEHGYLTPPASCSCVLRIEKPVIVISSAGAAVTLIDGRSVDVIQNVLILADGGEFGRPGKGFTVTQTAQRDGAGQLPGDGIVLDSADVMVRGNQVIFTGFGNSLGYGILTVNDAPIRIEGNQVTGWLTGILGRGAATVSKNQVVRNGYGIDATGGSVVGNVATDNSYGIRIEGSPRVTSNALYANVLAGIAVRPTLPFSGVVSKNNFFGSDDDSNCGLINLGVVGLQATNNYWGAATGPGALPADNVCHPFGGTTTTSPFATKPFAVKVLKP
jgi:parallel beta-helix repeat protein